MKEELDPRIEALFMEAQGREDVFRFRRMLGEVAASVEASEAETRVIPIERGANWKWLAAAASIAVLVTVGIALFDREPDFGVLAMSYAVNTAPLTRGDANGQPSSLELAFDEARTAILEGRAEQALAVLETTTPVATCDIVRKQWLLGLAYLAHQGSDAAKQEIQTVANSGCQDKDAARELLKKL